MSSIIYNKAVFIKMKLELMDSLEYKSINKQLLLLLFFSSVIYGIGK